MSTNTLQSKAYQETPVVPHDVERDGPTDEQILRWSAQIRLEALDAEREAE